MPRLVIISNRLPITIDKNKGELFYHPSAGGLATGLNSLDQDIERIWIGWPGKSIQNPKLQDKVREDLKDKNLFPVFLTDHEIRKHYEGFSNKTIWPHFHYFPEKTTYSEGYWKVYKKVNEKFAEIVCNLIEEQDIIWVHDYQLMLLPQMIRAKFPNHSIGFFLHIPFPSYEMFRTLPWRSEILYGLLGADQIGFHTFGYMRHFLSAVYRITGHEHNFGKITLGARLINVDVFPMGIEYDKYAFPTEMPEENNIEKHFHRKGGKLILSIDRLDYTKGIPERIKAFDKFLINHPEYKGKVTLAMIVVPSRSNVNQYQSLKQTVDVLVSKINSQYGTFDWTPLIYLYRSLTFNELTSYYHAADIALITPLRDGMNLVAKEYIASKEKSKKGVLILSEMAGAATELTEALLVNPHDKYGIVDAIVKALEMPLTEQKERLEKMQEKIQKFNVKYWAETFINEQIEMAEFRKKQTTNQLGKDLLEELIDDYKQSKTRLLILDYDGTLMNFKDDPKAVVPDDELLNVLKTLTADDNNELVVISGRDKDTLEEWLSPLGIDMAAEHGVWTKQNNLWKSAIEMSADWKNDIKPVLQNLVERTPGSFIEEKDYSLAWHYRKTDKDLGQKRVREFRDILLYLTANLDLQVLEGNKVVEIKNSGVNKGKAALKWINKNDWDFILAIGDDHTDEDIFKALPSTAWTVKVGLDKTSARFNLLSVEQVRQLLGRIAKT